MMKPPGGKGRRKSTSRESLLSDEQSLQEYQSSSKTNIMGNAMKTQDGSIFSQVTSDEDSMEGGSHRSFSIKGTGSEYEPSDDLITPEKEDTTEVKKRKFYKYMLAGYMLICIGLLCHTLLLIAGQLTVQQISLFETGIFKCIIQLFTSGSTVLILRLPWKINWQHFHLAFLAAICEYVGNACFYTASSLLPINDLQVLFSVLVIMLTAVVDTTAGRLNISSIICGVVTSAGILLLVQPWNTQFGVLGPAPCEVMHLFHTDTNSTGSNLTTGVSALTHVVMDRRVHRVVSFVGIAVDAEITGYLLVFFGAIAVTAFYNFIQLLGQLYPIPTTILWVGATESCLSLLLAIVINHWKEPREYFCIIFVICFVVMKVALTFTFYFAFYFLKISHVITTLAGSYVIVYMFQTTFLADFYPSHSDITQIGGTMLVVLGVMLFPCMIIMSKHNPYKIPDICEMEDEDD